jgi:ABC-2 type transport system ATP-binding protein
MRMSDPAIELQGVSVDYRLHRIRSLKEFTLRKVGRRLDDSRVHALRDVTLQIAPGESVGIIGNNGAGKSTLLRVAAGIITPSAGVSVSRGTMAPLLELGTGFEVELSGRENIFFNGALLGRSKAQMQAHLDEIIAFSGLERFLDAPLRTYSTGMVARLAFSIATAVDAETILLDEILAVGDASFRDRRRPDRRDHRSLRARAAAADRVMRRALLAALVVIPIVVLALYPPTGFDETLYHLPLVRAMAHDGLRFHPELRFPAFPLLAELLALPPYLLGGAIATHAIPLLATLLTVLLLVRWARFRGIHPELLPAAAFLGTPIVVHLGTSLYVEAVLTLFITAGFYFLDRGVASSRGRVLVVAGLFLGAACATKYLALYFAAIAALSLIRSRRFLPFAVGFLVAALPMYGWLVAQTGNPLFPYFGANPWSPGLPPPVPLLERVIELVRIPWDVIFARDRMNLQPPFTPLFGLALLATLTMRRSRWAILGYLVIFTFLPRDARYLVPLLPLLFIEAATLLPTIPRWLGAAACIVAIVTGPAYAIYRIVRQGPLPLTATQQTAYLTRRVPGYRAVRQAGTSRTYACRGEELQYYARGPFLGDHVGPYSYARVLEQGRDARRMHANLAALHVDTLLVDKQACMHLPLPARGFTLIYEDEAAQLWRVDRERPATP